MKKKPHGWRAETRHLRKSPASGILHCWRKGSRKLSPKMISIAFSKDCRGGGLSNTRPPQGCSCRHLTAALASTVSHHVWFTIHLYSFSCTPSPVSFSSVTNHTSVSRITYGSRYRTWMARGSYKRDAGKVRGRVWTLLLGAGGGWLPQGLGGNVGYPLP